jgi:DNA-binding transcriptional ArsR family regulator
MRMSVFLDKTADTPAFRILEYFLEARETDHAISDVIEATGLSRSTFYTAWPRVLANGFVKQSRVVGKTRLYRLATDNNYVKLYCELFDTSIQQVTHPRKQKVAA